MEAARTLWAGVRLFGDGDGVHLATVKSEEALGEEAAPALGAVVCPQGAAAPFALDRPAALEPNQILVWVGPLEVFLQVRDVSEGN